MADVYDSLEVRKVINGWGTLTMLGGSVMEKKTVEAMVAASRYFIDLADFHEKAGRKIADLLQVPAACVTSGAAAGIAICAAASMTGMNPANILQLPDTEGMKNEAIMLKCHRNSYDQALLESGMKIVEVGVTASACVEMIEKAINPKTALFFFVSESRDMRGSIPFSEIVKVCKAHNIPILVDCAADIPPAENIRKYLNLGADCVVFSGGKEIRGPQSSGLILGTDPDFIKACSANCCPHHSVGRPMKVDKESIAGLVVAVEQFVKRDYKKISSDWNAWVDQMVVALDSSKLKAWKGNPTEPGVEPKVIPRAYLSSLTFSAEQLRDMLLEGNPAIRVGIEQGNVAINPQCLMEEQVPIIIKRIDEIMQNIE
ncbi:aminotransferase class V-fold PLP-dependent enzyme [uncultured Sphaerochaeta sp.]|uniref:aminotransferase class V-fold PLP-dependent enzyme n=1 Tax=uncultured Sphaerochaeta sp. TaxID=886478 RepID=UPI002A0A68E4|nr:aminotransferase class V-fold PLP-dependent enzyme [uncultured Sphaerochaeta sp.]